MRQRLLYLFTGLTVSLAVASVGTIAYLLGRWVEREKEAERQLNLEMFGV